MPKRRLKLKPLILAPLIVLILFLAFFDLMLDRIYPAISVAGVNLSFLSPSQAQEALDQTLKPRLKVVSFEYNGQTYSLDLSSQAMQDDQLINQAFSIGHSKFYSPQSFGAFTDLSPKIKSQITGVAAQINQPSVDSTLKYENNQISVSASKEGLGLDEDALKTSLLSYLNTGSPLPTTLPTKVLTPHLSYAQALELKKQLDNLSLKPLNLQYKDQTFELALPDLISMVDTDSSASILASALIFGKNVTLKEVSWNNSVADTKLSLNKEKLMAYLKQNISPQIDRGVKEPILVLDPANPNKATQFQPPTVGLKLNLEQSAQVINQGLVSGDTNPINLAVDVTPPKNALVNQLGIKELIGEGVSHFAHSIPNRVYNVELAASRINGTIVPPGGIFSYNQSVGDVSAASGYKQGYVIKSGRTVLDDGGGVCQDSTTAFRAALNAGLPIVERVAHAYRVGYYEQDSPPGIDATVFAPSVDFKFKNDTPASILVWAQTYNDDTLIIDLYGTSDGRVATLTTPVVTSQTPPPPDVHQPDPTIPKGQSKQVDFSAWGANVVFSRTVTRDGQIIANDTYRSNYQPWAAVYLDGTGG